MHPGTAFLALGSLLAAACAPHRPPEPAAPTPVLEPEDPPCARAADAAERLRACAEQCHDGVLADCAALARLIHRGDGAPRDSAFAALLYRYACDSGHAPSCHELGNMYYFGDGLPQDSERAVALYDRLCGQGFTTACLVLGYLFERGLGVRRDAARALREYRRACALGSSAACSLVEQMAR